MELDLPTLGYRRKRRDRYDTEMYKILTAKYDAEVCDFILLNRKDTRGHENLQRTNPFEYK